MLCGFTSQNLLHIHAGMFNEAVILTNYSGFQTGKRSQTCTTKVHLYATCLAFHHLVLKWPHELSTYSFKSRILSVMGFCMCHCVQPSCIRPAYIEPIDYNIRLIPPKNGISNMCRLQGRRIKDIKKHLDVRTLMFCHSSSTACWYFRNLFCIPHNSPHPLA